MKKVRDAIATSVLKAFVQLEVRQNSVARKAASSPATMAAYAAGYVATFSLLMLLPHAAHAQQTLGDSLNTAGSSVTAWQTFAGKVGLAGGAGMGVGGGFKMHQRSKEGENSQVKMGTIVGMFGAGVLSAGAGAMLLRAGATVGLQSSDYGSVPGGG